MGYKGLTLLMAMDRSHAESVINQIGGSIRLDNWENEGGGIKTDLEIKGEMEAYMAFALKKAKDERAMSALRSICKYIVWIWLLGDEGRFENLDDYESFGELELKIICRFYGWDELL